MSARPLVFVALLVLATSAVSAQRVSDDAIAAMAKLQRDNWKTTDGKPVRAQYQLYERLISFALPKHFVPSYQEQQGGQFIVEFVPDGETSENWTQLITVRALHGLGRALVSSDVVADKLFNPKICTNGPIYQNHGERTFAPGVTVTTISLGCAALPKGAYPNAMTGAGEQDFVWLFRDDTNLYVIKSSVRGAAWPAGKPPIPVADAERQLALLGPIQLCADAATDKPCKTMLLLEKARRGRK